MLWIKGCTLANRGPRTDAPELRSLRSRMDHEDWQVGGLENVVADAAEQERAQLPVPARAGHEQVVVARLRLLNDLPAGVPSLRGSC